MSRYRASGEFAYREPPPPPRWDADRFAREREYRQTEEYYAPAPPQPRRPARPVYEEERVYYEDDRYGPGGARMERRYFEEDDYYDPRVQRGQMIPFRQARPPMQEAPPRPGLLRRQSSLDTFDRPPRRYNDYDGYGPPPDRQPRIPVDVPDQQSPRPNRYRPARPSRPVNDYQGYQNSYDDVAIQDPDYYGDEGFREYREREWVRHRSRDSSEARSHSRSRPTTEAPTEESKSGKKETVKREEVKEEVKKEKTYPRRGKTRMPKRLVHTKVLFDLGYPFYEEGDKTIIIEKALGPENIDEVFAKSREYREKEVSTTRLIEAPPPPPPSARPPPREEVIKETEIKTIPISEAPRSVREWDQLTVKDDTRTSDRRKSNARPKSRRSSEVAKETVIERRSTVVEREPSPSPRRRRKSKARSKSKRRSSSSSSSEDRTEIIQRKIITEEDGIFADESNSVRVGPLALVLDRDKDRRSERDIKEQIRQLEAEQRALRRERRSDRVSSDFVKIERRRESRSPSPFREVIIERRRSPSPVREVLIERRRSPSPFKEVYIERRRSPSPVKSERIILDRHIDHHHVVEYDRRRSPSPYGQIIVDRGRSPSPYREIVVASPPPVSHTGELRIDRNGDEIVDIRKTRRERSFSRSRAPSAGLIKGMFYTLT